MLLAKVIAKLEPGGAQLSLLRIARAFALRGQETRLLVGRASAEGVALARSHGVVPEVMGPGEDLQWRCSPEFSEWLEPRLADADLVHAHMFGAWSAAGSVLEPGIPFVASEHNDLLWTADQQWDTKAEVVSRIDRFYAHSPGARADVVRAGVPEDRVVRGISPVDGFDHPERSGLPSPRIVFNGRLAPDKAPDVLVEAIALMASPPPVFILGSGVLESMLRALIADAGLEHVVHLCGWVGDPAGWVANASVQVCPSRDEAFSQSAVLAMGLGVPVIGTRVDGFPETLGDSRGVMIEPDDPVALAAAIEDVLDGRRRTDVAGARTWACQFEIDRVTSMYERDYRECRERVPT